MEKLIKTLFKILEKDELTPFEIMSSLLITSKELQTELKKGYLTWEGNKIRSKEGN